MLNQSFGRVTLWLLRRLLMRTILAAIIAGLLALASPVHAQDWPSRQITIVVPFGAGGSADLLAHILATQMQAKFGQPVVVENRGGGGGSRRTGVFRQGTASA